MLMELHCHTSLHSPCSHIDPVELVRQVMRKQLQGMVITEHHYVWTPEEIAHLRYEAAVEDYFVILAAQEVETDIGHVLCFGPDTTIPHRMKLADLRRAYPEAALVWAHPLRSGKAPAREKLQNPLLDGIEIFSSNHTPSAHYLGLKLWHNLKFTAVAGSDAHAADTAGILPTLFDHPIQTAADLAVEIRHGRCRPFFKEVPKAGGTGTVQEIVLGTKGDDEARSRLILKSAGSPDKWKKAQASAHIAQNLHDLGFAEGQLRVPKIVAIDAEERLVIEEGQRGKSLFDLLIQVSPESGELYFQLAARWLAELHKRRIRSAETPDTVKRERRRFSSYLASFRSTRSPHLAQAKALVEAVQEHEERIFATRQDDFIQIHGDYHPKNIIIGQDRMQDLGTLFVSVIDFGSAMSFVPAFDVGYFLAQFAYQLLAHPTVIERYPAHAFLQAYADTLGEPLRDDFRREVDLFRIRASLSIASFLIKVGKGISPDMDYLMRESRELLAGIPSS